MVARVKAAAIATCGVGTGVSGSGSRLEARETIGDEGTGGSACPGSAGMGSVLGGVTWAGSATVTEVRGSGVEAGAGTTTGGGASLAGLSTEEVGAGLARAAFGFVRLNFDQYCFITSLDGVAIGSSSFNPFSPVRLPCSLGGSTGVDTTVLGGGGGTVEGIGPTATTVGAVGGTDGTASSPTGRVVSYIRTNMRKGKQINVDISYRQLSLYIHHELCNAVPRILQASNSASNPPTPMSVIAWGHVASTCSWERDCMMASSFDLKKVVCDVYY